MQFHIKAGPSDTIQSFKVRNTLVQLLALYTEPESHNAQRYRRTDRVQQTDDIIMTIA